MRSELVRIRRLGSHCILISLCIGGSREVEVSVNGSFVGGCETDTIIMRRMDVMENIQSSLPVTRGQMVVVG